MSASGSWKAIAAMARNRVIGDKNTIPWHFPEDYRWFKKNTLGATLVMGRKTYESIGRPLPKRTTVVLSRTAKPEDFPEGVLLVRSLDEVEALGTPGPIWLAGGAEVYALGMDRCAELYLTIIQEDFAGDATFPRVETSFPKKTCLETSGPLEFWKFSRDS
ncbi:MAG: dihydrofolate reductase [Opitutales bacterium]